VFLVEYRQEVRLNLKTGEVVEIYSRHDSPETEVVRVAVRAFYTCDSIGLDEPWVRIGVRPTLLDAFVSSPYTRVEYTHKYLVDYMRRRSATDEQIDFALCSYSYTVANEKRWLQVQFSENEVYIVLLDGSELTLWKH
jgi:hypothetical protein